jgi:hypothetical protein
MLTLSEHHRGQRRPRPPTLATNNILIADFSPIYRAGKELQFPRVMLTTLSMRLDQIQIALNNLLTWAKEQQRNADDEGNGAIGGRVATINLFAFQCPEYVGQTQSL